MRQEKIADNGVAFLEGRDCITINELDIDLNKSNSIPYYIAHWTCQKCNAANTTTLPGTLLLKSGTKCQKCHAHYNIMPDNKLICLFETHRIKSIQYQHDSFNGLTSHSNEDIENLGSTFRHKIHRLQSKIFMSS